MSDEHTPRGGRVLLAEPDPRVGRTTARMLRLLGYRVAEVADVAAALRLLHETADIALLLTSSPELVPLARGLRPALPVVLTGGFAETPVSLPRGTACLSKPYTRPGLAHALRQVLDA